MVLVWSIDGVDFPYESLEDLFDNEKIKIGQVVFFGKKEEFFFRSDCNVKGVIALLQGQATEKRDEITREALEELESSLIEWMQKYIGPVSHFVQRTRSIEKHVVSKLDFYRAGYFDVE